MILNWVPYSVDMNPEAIKLILSDIIKQLFQKKFSMDSGW